VLDLTELAQPPRKRQYLRKWPQRASRIFWRPWSRCHWSV